MKKPLITLTSDFGVQSQGIGCMEATILEISPDANVVHLMHGLSDFDVITAARTMETIKCIQVGYHICVVDPGVGTKRKGVIINTKRGDYLIGPDNGVLVPATKILGGCKKIVEISNPKYMKHPVSPIFHGRDVFSTAAAYLSVGIPIEEFGKRLNFEHLNKAPYDEAEIIYDHIKAKVIHINKYGSLVLNTQPSLFEKFGIVKNDIVLLEFKDNKVKVLFVDAFGDVAKGKLLILNDDYGRNGVAINLGNFAKTYKVKIGDNCTIKKVSK
jgi:S-adenosylmethionine hydrolase